MSKSGAYENYAIKAIKYAAFDYLMKPIDPEELSKALDNFRIKQTKTNKLNIEALKEILNPCPKIRVPVPNGLEFVNPNEILYVEGEGAYSIIYTSNLTKLIVSRNLKSIETWQNSEIAVACLSTKSPLVGVNLVGNHDEINNTCIFLLL